MTEDQNPSSESLQKSAHAANKIRGAVKTGKAISNVTKGAAAGGPYGAITGFVLENRKLISKIIITAIALFMIPVLIICMLPSVIFNGLKEAFSPNDPTPILNDNAVITNNLNDISESIGAVMAEAMEDVFAQIDKDFANSEAIQKEIIYSNERTNDSVIIFISQYSASKNEDYQSVSISDMENLLRSHKDKLYSYTVTVEDRTRIIQTTTTDKKTGKEIITETEIVEKWAVYNIVYNGEDYFANHVFSLSEEQKRLAENYAENLKLFLSSSTFY